MLRIAYLIGPTGSGKTYITNKLRGSSHIITADAIQHWTAVRLCPFLTSGAFDWRLWKLLLKHCDVRNAIQLTFRERNLIPSDNLRPILAEGAILGLSDFRHAFAEALKNEGLSIGEERVFWLDPKAPVLLSRVKERGRPNQSDYNLKKAEDSRRWFAKEVGELDCLRFDKSDDILSALRGYFDVTLRDSKY